jgi:hypothetical protein
LPHVPQFVGSVIVLVHAAPHIVRVHVALHAPAMQYGAVAGQTVPQLPQLLTSVAVRTHEIPPGGQAMNGAAQVHWPALHD